MGKYVIALDQGTTSSRAIIFDKEQNIIGMSQKEITQIYPRAGWVEQNPMEIWASQYGVLQEVIAKTNINLSDISAVGISNQRETTVVWDRFTGMPIYNAIVWQCRRTTNLMESLKEDKELEEYIKENTGLLLDSYFSASKIKWILDNVEGARERAKKGELLFGTIDTWLVWKFTNGKAHVTDYTNASRTMLFNIKTLEWDEYLLNKFNIPANIMPRVRNSSEIYGRITLSKDKAYNIPIASIVGDQQAALIGQNCFNKGDIKNTYGTGCFMLMNTGDTLVRSKNGLISTIALGMNGKVKYALEGSVFSGAGVLKWLKDDLKIINDEKDSEYFAKKVNDNGGVYIVPAFSGLGAPYWNMRARGAIFGLTGGSSKDHIIRAALESIAYQCADVLKTMEEESNINITELKVDGGASKNKFLMQFQANIMDIKLVKPIISETTSLGAAYLAGLAVGFWKDTDEISKGWYTAETYKCKIYRGEREKLYKGWKKAISKSMDWEED